jgi:CheY-like chemotaxis protein
MRTKSILLADDHADNLELLSIILGEDYNVRACASAVEALIALEEFTPDLLVLDVRMHPFDGVECLKAIRAKPGYTTIPAIALTALARDVDRAALLEAGFDDVVTKPIFDYECLKRTIDGLLKSSAMYNIRPDEQASVA